MNSIDFDCSGPKFSGLPRAIREHNALLSVPLHRNPIELEEALEAMEILDPLDEVLKLMRSGQIEKAHDKLNALSHPRYNRIAITSNSEAV